MSPEPKYAKPERELRYVSSHVPSDAAEAQEIDDLYIVGTRMRLRSVTSSAGKVYKLGHKVRIDSDDPRLVMHTSLYLSSAEYEVLASLPGRRLQKTRHRVVLTTGTMSVDAFHRALEGLVLAEVDLEAQQGLNEPFDPPSYCVADVSRDERFTGGALAATDRLTMIAILEEVSGLRLLKRIYHIALKSDWDDAQSTGEYQMSTRGARLDEIGFIHASFEEQVGRVGNAFYDEQCGPLLVLEIDPARLESPVRVENLDGGDESFPHIYGPLPTSAVVNVLDVVFEGGRFVIDRRG